MGAAALLVVLGSLATAAVAVRRRALPEWTGAPARLAEIVTGLALLIGILEVLGAVGLFELGPIVIACALAAMAGLRSLAGTQVPRHRHAWDSDRAAWLLSALALLAGAAVIAEWVVPTLVSYDIGIRSFDSLWYHLPWAACFAQTGRVTSLRFTDVEYLTAFYPATAECCTDSGSCCSGGTRSRRRSISGGFRSPCSRHGASAGLAVSVRRR